MPSPMQSQSRFVEPAQLRDVEQRTLVRHIQTIDRTTGNVPYAISKIGDDTFLWAATGLIRSGAEASVPLTRNRQALGGSLFTRIPEVMVLEDVSGGNQLSRATGPAGPSLSLSLRPLTDATWVLNWVGADQRWDVVVTNSGSTARDFVVMARGV